MKWIFLLLALLIPGLANAQSYNALSFTAGSFNQTGCNGTGGVCFADLNKLPTVQNGTLTYCKDCQVDVGNKNTNCAAGGTGSMAVRINGYWDCTLGNWTDLVTELDGDFAPLVNPAGGTNNYAPLTNPNFTGQITINGMVVQPGGGANGSVPTGPTPPSAPGLGQLWYDTTSTPAILKVWDGVTWVQVSNETGNNSGPTAPNNPVLGQIWYDTSVTPATLKVWDGTAWVVAGGGGGGTGGLVNMACTVSGNFMYGVQDGTPLCSAPPGTLTAVYPPGPVSITGNSGNGTDKISGISSINNTTVYADQFSGASMDAKLTAAEAACPASGCTIDASNFSGPQTWTNTFTVNKPIKLKLNGQISYTGPPLANGLIYLADTAGSGADISCSPAGIGPAIIWPAVANYPVSMGGPLTLNPPNLLQQWPCYILTKPNAPLGTVNITSVSTNLTPPPLATANTTGPPPFIAGQAVRLSGFTGAGATYNSYVIVQSVSGNSFTFHWHPPQPTSAGTGTATSYMPVIFITYSNSNIYIHDINFVANQNTGSVILESSGNRYGQPVMNNHYNHNQIVNSDGIGNSGYGIEISSMGGMAANTNVKEIKYNNFSGVAGCYMIDQSNIVTADIVGNSCGFNTNAPAFKLDCYQCIYTQNTDFRMNIFWASLGPPNQPVVEINSGANVNIENNDFELPNMLQNGGVDTIAIHQMGGQIFNNAFLSTPGQNAGRYSINVDTSSAYGYLRIEGNHSSGGEYTFFNDPVNPGGNQGHLYYGWNEDFSRNPGTGTVLYPSVLQFTGSSSGVPYTTTSASWVPVDNSRFMDDFWMPDGYSAMISATGNLENDTGTQPGCLGIQDLVTGNTLTGKMGPVGVNGGDTTVQYMLPVYNANKHFQIALVFSSCAGLGTTSLMNQNTVFRPQMTVNMIPAHGGSN